MTDIVVKVKIHKPDWLFRLGETATVTGEVIGYELTPEVAAVERATNEAERG